MISNLQNVIDNQDFKCLVSSIASWYECLRSIHFNMNYKDLINRYKLDPDNNLDIKNILATISMLGRNISLVNNRIYHCRLSPRVLLLINKYPYFSLEYNILDINNSDRLKFMSHNSMLAELIDLGYIELSGKYEGFDFTSMIYSDNFLSLL